MADSNAPAARPSRPKSKTPAERAEEYSAIQRQLKEEAAARREAASKGSGKGRKKKG
ncbi:MAG TPA: hypothetical protein VHF89_15475 [Solirubrobacteraceae bacterium]|nr:hypothetical protein [Solirubrobacteraceae bacterium]